MATRSSIAYEDVNGIVTKIYCHWDGYPSHNGRILQEHYSDLTKLNHLMQLGDLSVLDAELGDKQDFDNRQDGWCLAYGRDRGESGCEARVYDSFQEYKTRAGMESYNYIFRNGRWFVSKYEGGFQELDKALVMEC